MTRVNEPNATPLLYGELAHLWPLLSPPEDYQVETQRLHARLTARLGNRAGRRLRVLELGAGGGHTLVHLAHDCDCTAVDLSQAMLANCQRLVPSARTVVGDMRHIRLNETFDAVLIHDAIDYMTTLEDVRATLDTAAAHLEPGGLIAVAPTYVYEFFQDHEAEHDFNENDQLELTYFSYVHDPDPADSMFEMILIYLIRQQGRVRVVEDRHTCGLFSIRQWHEQLTAAGFDAETFDEGDEDQPYVLFVGEKCGV